VLVIERARPGMLGLMTTEHAILLTGEFTTPLFVGLDNLEFARCSTCDCTMREPCQPDGGHGGGFPKDDFATTDHLRSTFMLDHSITSSASASNVFGTVRFIALAVLRLSTNK